MNLYGKGPGLIRRPRSYMVEATCKVRVGFYARGPEDAEVQFYDYTQAVESNHPEIVFEETTEIYEDD